MHIPVLQKEVLEYLDPKPNENFIDCTIGEAGHSLAILEKIAPKGKILGIEWDTELFKKLEKECLIWQIKQRLILVNGSYANLEEIVKRENFKPVSGILFDLGISSWHLEGSKRGFSFLGKEPLDMRYNLQNPLTAEKLLNYWSRDEIEKILREFGEENFSKKISEKIIEMRKIKSIEDTLQLVEIIKRAVPNRYLHPRRRTPNKFFQNYTGQASSLRGRQKINPATRTFQALRIAVNNELKNLQEVLPQTLEVLERGGRLVIISFHSLEDRIVKNFIREKSQNNLIKILTKKPIVPTDEEIKINPRSRSAKLRAAQLN